MPDLYYASYTIQQLRRRVGDMSQLAGIRSSTLNDGPASGVRALEFYTGSGLRFTVLPDRGMDIAAAEWRGAPIAWRSSTGVTHPAYYEEQGLGWLRGFSGGLLVTCGFMNVALAAVDQDEHFGIHGRASYLPASNVAYDAGWEGDDYVLSATGKIRETRLFGENVLLTRTIKSRLGAATISITDVFENQGFEPTPFMILYHINAGFPLLDETSRLSIDSEIIPRDEDAAKGIELARQGGPPIAGFKEQVHQHKVAPGPDGWAQATLTNPAFNKQ